MRIDMNGRIINNIEVLRYSHSNKKGDAMWECRCRCGNTFTARGTDIRRGHTTSCGCLQREMTAEASKKHGMSKTRLYYVYSTMLKRCYLSSHKSYKNYGGRGIAVCDEWKNDFKTFFEWAMENGYEEGLSIDRIDVNGNYNPSNCRWASAKEQQNNRRNNRMITCNGKTQTMQQWADEIGVDARKIHNRINILHWDVEKALFHDSKGGTLCLKK